MKLYFYITTLFLLSPQFNLNAQCDHPDYEALMELYDSTNGDFWSSNEGWKTASQDDFCDPCDGTWTGIECTDGRVTSINLSSNNLRGELEDLNFPNLQTLRLLRNNLEGTIPDFSGLKKLEHLTLSGNKFNGAIPNFQNLPSLTELLLDNNNLNGPIPYFEKCLNLGGMDLSLNELNDTIPNFDDLINLGIIQIASAGLFGKVPRFSNNQKLIALVMSDNKLTGSIEHLGDLPELSFVFMENNMLSGCMPILEGNQTIGDQIISLSGNSEMAWFGDYYMFMVNDFNDLSAPCSPYDIPGARGLLDQNCACKPEECNSNNPDLAELMKIYNATNGDNWTNNYGWIAAKQGYRCNPCDMQFGNFYGVTCENDKIICIDFDGAETCDFNGFNGNNLEGEWPKLNLEDLEFLILDDNELTGNIPDVSLMNSLKELRASRNNFTGSMPDFKENNFLETVRLSFNNLSGALPYTIEAPSLEFMTITDNNFSGCYPPWVCDLELFEASGNDDLPWYGDRTNYCDNVPQFMAPCGDSTMSFGILGDCSCGNLSTLTKDVADVEINIFPNPTCDYLNIVSHIQTDFANVYNMQGKLVTSQTVSNAQVDVTDLIKGIYLIEIVSENKTTTLQKFVKL